MRIVTLLATVCVLSAGCMMPGSKGASAEEPGTPMGAKAPSFEGDWSKFIAGRWSPSSGDTIDPELAKQMGVESVNTGGEVDTKRWWKFKPDGKFEYRIKAFSWVIEGTWIVENDALHLQYLTLDGDTFPEAQMKFKKAAEDGGSAAIADDIAMDFVFDKLPTYNTLKLHSDKKRVYFELGGGADPAMGGLGGFGRKVLERVD